MVRTSWYEVDTESRLPHVRRDTLAIEPSTSVIRDEGDHPPTACVPKDCSLRTRARRLEHSVDADKVRYDHSGRYSAFGFFQYFGP